VTTLAEPMADPFPEVRYRMRWADDTHAVVAGGDGRALTDLNLNPLDS
jgi:hypothetical protein